MADSQVTDDLDDEIVDSGVEEIGEIRDDGADAGEAVEDEQQFADERVAELQRELTTERDKYLRLAAEFDNFRKRTSRERAEAQARGQAELVKELLDPLDDIARFAHVDPAVTESATIVQGVEMVEKKLGKALRAAGLEPVDPIAERFNPALHEAVGTDAADTEDEDGRISRVYQIGYTFKGQLLRPARVVVMQHGRSD